MADSREMDVLKTAVKAIDDKLGTKISVLNIGKISPMADYFVIATAGNPSQMKAIADDIEEKLFRGHGVRLKHAEGYNDTQWILLDFDWIIVHLFLRDARHFYNLDSVWKDAEAIDIKEWVKPEDHTPR